MKKILIISPCFNVEKYVQEHINKLLEIVHKEDILLINDGSTDSTKKIIEKNNMKLISWDEKKGKATALKSGFGFAIKNNYEALITIDSDLQHNQKSIIDLIKKVESDGSSIVIARRSFSLKSMPFSRIISNLLSSKIVSLLVDTDIYDSQCGLRYIDRDFLNIDIKAEGFQFETEHLIRACWNGAKVSHIQTETIYNHSKSSMKYLTDMFKFSKLFLKLFREKKMKNVQKTDW